MMTAELMRVLGLDDPGSPFYLWWSGACGDLGILAAGYAIWRRHNCHVRHCPRIIWKHDGDDALCRKHHPDSPPSV